MSRPPKYAHGYLDRHGNPRFGSSTPMMTRCRLKRRPILLNGIEEVISRPDLGDRAIFLTLAPIGEAQRRPESELWREFEIARPRILGALLDAVAHGLRVWMGCISKGCRALRLPRCREADARV
jgi:hypothetical protein